MSGEQLSVKGTIPLGVRLRMALGFRVSTEYRDWAIEQINSTHWPTKQAFAKLLIVWPAALIGILAVEAPKAGSVPWSGVLGQMFIMTITFLVVSLVLGRVSESWVRRRAIQHQMKEK